VCNTINRIRYKEHKRKCHEHRYPRDPEPTEQELHGAPVQKLNAIAIANTEKLIAFQTTNLQEYAELGIAQWKTAAEVNDPESLVAYLTAQGARLTEAGEQVIADTKQAYQLGMDFLSEAQKVAQENITSVTDVVKEKTPVCNSPQYVSPLPPFRRYFYGFPDTLASASSAPEFEAPPPPLPTNRTTPSASSPSGRSAPTPATGTIPRTGSG
jgi:phasin family protein